MENPNEAGAGTAIGPTTAPERFGITSRAFDTEHLARQMGELVGDYVRELSRLFDLGRLDGVTLAFDYSQALLDLDRGYETAYRLKASDNDVVGVAMTPSVLRDGVLKSHIVLNAAFMMPLQSPDDCNFDLALHTLAHECAHVEITSRFDAAFPNVLLRKTHPNSRFAYRWQTMLGCWDEYAATRFSAGIGRDFTQEYEDSFVKRLKEARPTANRLIREFRVHRDVSQILREVYEVYGGLLKLAAYHLGNLVGHESSPEQRPRTTGALEGHWFASYFRRLEAICQCIASEYGKWADQSSFEQIGDLVDEIVAEGGVQVTDLPDGRVHVNIPFTLETMP